MRLVIPVLVEVCAASVPVNIRAQALAGMLKAASFLEQDELWNAIEVCYSYCREIWEGLTRLGQHVPLASFIGPFLSSRDHQTLLTGALQLMELLLMKLSVEYKSAFQREGVLH